MDPLRAHFQPPLPLRAVPLGCRGFTGQGEAERLLMDFRYIKLKAATEGKRDGGKRFRMSSDL